uniref:MATH domain-containing protein n=1 Tax=Leersia perrieri TaxID=77586 RepID=A0A0D9XKN3_9ORYZ
MGACASSSRASSVPPSLEEKKTFKWMIDGFSSLLDKGDVWTYSSVFEIMGIKWYLKVNPKDKKNGEEYVSLRLELSNPSLKIDTVVNAYFKFLIYDQSYGKHSEHQVTHKFQTASTSSGTSYMIPLKTLNSSGFLLGDSCVFGVQFVKVVTAKANDKSEILFVQKMNTFNEAKVYTWEIEDFFALKNPSYSPEFELDGHKWLLRIYPSGKDKNENYLSLILEMKDIPCKNSANLVELSISIKDQETANHWKRTGRCQFSENSKSWGWPKFMSLEDFKNSSNGYLVKTKCCIEAEVAIVGRSNEKKLKSKQAVTVPSISSAQTTFKWRIDGFSSLLDKGEGWTYSRVFKIMGLNWYLKLNPMDRKSGDETEYVSLNLELCNTSLKPDTVVDASFKFLIYDQTYGNHNEHQVTHKFQTASSSSGTLCMIPLSTLKSSPGFIFNNSCVFGVEFIKVVAAKVKDTSETLFVQKINAFTEVKAFTWDIEDFFALKSPSYSPEFELGGHKWFLSIYPTGYDKNGNYLSLYLHMKTQNIPNQNSAELVDYCIGIKNQETGKHRKEAGRCQFSKNVDNWGFNKFMSLEDFKDSSNGYLVKTKCCIEAEVTIVGTSKMV